MSTTTEKPKPTPYGCAPGYVGPDPIRLMRSDCRGDYRRPSINLRTGEVIRDEQGAIVYDVVPNQPTRSHLSLVQKGYELVAVVEYDNPELAQGA